MSLRRSGEAAEQALLALALLVLGGAMGWNLYAEHARLETSERLRLADQARIIDDNLGRQIGAVNNALASLQQDLPGLLKQKQGLEQLNLRLRSLSGSMPGVRTLLVLDGEGIVTASNRAELIGQNLQERAYFKRARLDDDPNVLHVSSPISNTLGTFAINLERSTSDPRGRFAGLVAATLDPEYFTTLLDSVNYAPDMWASLAHADGTLFVIVPDQHIPAGNGLARPGSLFSRHMASGQRATVLTGRILATGEWRMAARRNVRPAAVPMDAPLEVAVTRNLAAIFAPWRRDLWSESGLFVLVALTTGGALFAHQKRQRSLAQLAAVQAAGLRRNEEQLRLFFDRQLVGMAIVSPQKGWVKVNDRLCQMLGYSREELKGRTWPELTHPDDLAESQASFKRFMAGAIDEYSCDKRYIRKDGTLLYAQLSIGCVRLPDGSADYFLDVMADITERVNEVSAHEAFERELAMRKEDLEALNRSLEARVQEAVSQLRAKDRILIAQSRQAALGEMIGNIAHQWRQPLNALSMVLINLKDARQFDELDQETFDRALAMGNRLIQKMSMTINDFRNFFRPGKERTRFSALEQVRAAVALLDAAFAAKGIAIAIETPGDPQLHGLPNEFSQVLVNLLSNAKQAILESRAAQGRITIRLQEQDGYGCLLVSDNGGGIPEQYLDRIFEPYFSTRESGTGIGLYMSRQIIEQSMKGRILARNAGAGAEFTVLVPLAGTRRRGGG
jgi:PAS domain S-box-containing protein